MIKTLCIIPARKGSRGLKNKNIAFLNRKPLILYPYIIAKKLRFLNDIVITSDSQKYLDLIKDRNIFKILRPKNLSKSNSKIIDVINHVLKKIKKKYEYILLLEPTSPLTSYQEIEKAFNILLQKNKLYDSIVSIVNIPKYHKNFSFKLKKNKIYNKFFPKQNVNRQDQKKEYFLSGNFYLSKTKKLIKNKSFVSKKTFGFDIKKSIHLDIDNKLDLLFAKTILENGLFKKIK